MNSQKHFRAFFSQSRTGRRWKKLNYRLSLIGLLMLIALPVSINRQSVAGVAFGAQQSTGQQTRFVDREIKLIGKDRNQVNFAVNAVGKIVVLGQWTGSANTLAFILNGPGQEQAYARQDGESPLRMEFEVTPEVLSRGKNWKLSVVNFSPRGTAKGKVRVSYPFAADTSGAKLLKPATLPQVKKSIRVEHFTVLESQGYSPEELSQLHAQLNLQKLEALKTKWQTALPVITHQNALSKIVIPLFMQRLEEKLNSGVWTYTYRIKSPPGTPDYSIDPREHLRTVVNAYKSLSTATKRQYLHPRYANLQPGDVVNKLQLGRDVLAAIRPNYQTEIQQMVQKAFASGRPTFQKQALIENKILAPRSTVQIQPLSPDQIRQFRTLLQTVHQQPSLSAQNQLRDYLRAQGFPMVEKEMSPLHRALTDISRLSPTFVPNFNEQHSVRNYYHYDVQMDYFACRDRNETWDEPYFHLSAVIPRYDPEDPENIHRLQEGQLYRVFSHITGSWGDVVGGSVRAFGPNDRWLIRDNIYDTRTLFTIDMWEEDNSKYAVSSSIFDAVNDLQEEIIQEIKDAVWEALEAAFSESLKQLFPEVAGFIDLFFSGDLSFDSLLDAVENAYGSIDLSWIALEMFFSGSSISSIITNLGASVPEIALILIAIKVAGPVLLDFFGELFSGNFLEALKTLLYLPLKLLEFVIDIFTDIADFFENLFNFFRDLLAMIDPDDHIQSHTITINGSTDNIYQDADWGLGAQNFVCVEIEAARRFHNEKGYGPIPENSSFINGNLLCQPALLFQGADAKYWVYYNVKRFLLGGRETFGYTVTPGESTFMQQRTYTAKTPFRGRTIKVSLCALNSDAVPFVWVSQIAKGGETRTASNGNLQGEREFEVEAVPGYTYNVLIANFSNIPLYGYVTLKEN